MPSNIFSRLRGNERASTLLLLTMFVVALFGFAALSIDVSHVFYQQRKAHIATDAGAFAAAALLASPETKTNKLAIIAEAFSIATTNGVTTTEIALSNFGTIQVGRWDTNSLTFTPDTTPYNAVRVPARRSVPMFFAKVVGLSHMAPAVRSVAYLRPNTVCKPAPLGISADALASIDNYDGGTSVSFAPGHDLGSGQWGQVNFNNAFKNGNEWLDAMTNGYGNCVSVGDPLAENTASPGVNALQNALEWVWANNVTMFIPVLPSGTVLQGPDPVTIIDFVGVRVVGVTKNGNQISVVLNFVAPPITTSGGVGNGPPPRAMVQ